VVILLPQILKFSILNFLSSPPCEGVIHGQILDVVMVWPWQAHWGAIISEVSFVQYGMPHWARIAQNVKKPPLTVNVIDFEFFGFNVSYWYLGVPLVPKSHDTLVELFRFTRYLERNKLNFAPFIRFH
jgi:hypothetical protein